MESRPSGRERKTLTRQGCLDSQVEKARLCAIGTRKAGHESVTKAHLAVILATVGKRDETGIK